MEKSELVISWRLENRLLQCVVGVADDRTRALTNFSLFGNKVLGQLPHVHCPLTHVSYLLQAPWAVGANTTHTGHQLRVAQPGSPFAASIAW